MEEVLEEAHELVEHDVITPDDFRDFVFTNPTTLWTGTNPDFFQRYGGRGGRGQAAGSRGGVTVRDVAQFGPFDFAPLRSG